MLPSALEGMPLVESVDELIVPEQVRAHSMRVLVSASEDHASCDCVLHLPRWLRADAVISASSGVLYEVLTSSITHVRLQWLRYALAHARREALAAQQLDGPLSKGAQHGDGQQTPRSYSDGGDARADRSAGLQDMEA